MDQEGKSYQANFSIAERVNFLDLIVTSANNMQARFFGENQILYLRIPRMRNLEEYMKVLDKFQQKDSVQYLILDIRGNGGGDDDVWKKIIAQCYDTVITQKALLGFLNKRIVLNSLKKMGVKISHEIQPESIPLFGSQKIHLLPIHGSTERFKKGVYKNVKNIFVFADDDCYSSSLVLTKYAFQQDNIITLGVNSGWIGGAGIAAMQFQMPNSKLLFLVESTIDLYDINNLRELYTPVKYELELTPDYFYTRKTKWNNSFDWLNENDPYFKQVINSINSN